MRNLALSLATLLLSGACAGAPLSHEPIDANNLTIEVGRWGVMVREIEDLHPAPGARGNTEADNADAGVSDADYLSPRFMEMQLRTTAQRGESLRQRLCEEHFVTGRVCTRPFHPRWLTAGSAASASLAEVAARSRDVGAFIMPLWDQVCARARASIADEDARRELCPME